MSIVKRKKRLEPDLPIHSQINSKWARYLNIRSKIIKILEENARMISLTLTLEMVI